MRKNITAMLLIAALTACVFCGCVKKHASPEELQRRLETVAETYGLELRSIDDRIDPEYGIAVPEGGSIRIKLFFDEGKRIDSFSIEYEKLNGTEGFDVGLFISLVNAVSGRRITTDYCEDFLEAPETEHPSGRYGHIMQEDELFAKWQALNLTEDWMIRHTKYKDGSETLSFGGPAFE
ncbi:MAG: hypothetical protein K6G56_07400 [Clostridiales bacterium]|nr:hypothetical protein [Clostridiales bacterium]